ncbi:MAG TPA: toll/interleukin-1 receptor domain-containing protein [Dehalococcoidia bacterium]|nr:toll/interleukin-1 receptor domain-containing protein [Dehalococcoidia bacterium]
MRVFISYARDDRERMLVIAEALRGAGHAVEVDSEILKGGDDFARKLEAAIGACDACVVLWSPRSTKGPWVPAEANLALQHGKRVIPVKLAECSIPLPFSTFHILDFTTSSDLPGLLASLEPGGKPPPVALPSRWPRRLAGAGVAVAVLSVGAWLAIPALQKAPPPPAPPVVAAAPPQQPDAGPAPEVKAPPEPKPEPKPGSKPSPKHALADPCAETRARFQRVQGDCQEACDLDHYPMRADLDRCRACDELRTQLQRCPKKETR